MIRSSILPDSCATASSPTKIDSKPAEHGSSPHTTCDTKTTDQGCGGDVGGCHERLEHTDEKPYSKALVRAHPSVLILSEKQRLCVLLFFRARSRGEASSPQLEAYVPVRLATISRNYTGKPRKNMGKPRKNDARAYLPNYALFPERSQHVVRYPDGGGRPRQEASAQEPDLFVDQSGRDRGSHCRLSAPCRASAWCCGRCCGRCWARGCGRRCTRRCAWSRGWSRGRPAMRIEMDRKESLTWSSSS